MTLIEVGKTLDIERMLKYIDKTQFTPVEKQSIKHMLKIVIPQGSDDITIDFEDFKKVIKHGKTALYGIGEHSGYNSAVEAMKSSIKSLFSNITFIQRFKGILVHFTIHPSTNIMTLLEAMKIVDQNSEADILFGISTDNSVDKHYVKVSILVTGFVIYNKKQLIINCTTYRKYEVEI